jgi:hypothetical protein
MKLNLKKAFDNSKAHKQRNYGEEKKMTSKVYNDMLTDTIEIEPVYDTLECINKDDRAIILDALRSNKRKARSTLKNNKGGRCCLRVIEESLIPFSEWTSFNEGIPEKLPFISEVDKNGTDFIIGRMRRLMVMPGGYMDEHRDVRMTHLNDGFNYATTFMGVKMPMRNGFASGYSHNQIAGFLEKMFDNIDKGVK